MTTTTVDAVVTETLSAGSATVTTDVVTREVLVNDTVAATVDTVFQEILLQNSNTPVTIDGVFLEALVATVIPTGTRRPNIPRSLLIR